MKTHFYLFASILLSLLCFQSKANHIRGLEISYQCTDTAQVYKVTIKVYRDCAEIQLCPSCSIPSPNGTVAGCNTNNASLTTSIRGLTTGFLGINYGSFVLNSVGSSSGYDIVNTCDSIKTNCTNCNTRTAGTFSPGVEVYTFEGNVNLSSIPTACCSVELGASFCCRGSALTYVSSSSVYSFAQINRCQSTCNSAPTFTNNPNMLVCAGIDYVYNLGASDPDGDSLSYDFGQAYQAYATPANYIIPFSARYPFPFFGAPNYYAAPPAGLRIDPATGDVLFRPMGVFVAKFIIEVTQWKKIGGVSTIIGVTRRDAELQTRLCASNRIPLVKIYKNNVLQFGQQYNISAGQQICLDIVSEDNFDLNAVPSILADTTDLKWNNPGLTIPVMANATFTRNYILANRRMSGPKADSFKFCWTPPINAARNEPYLFTVTGSDRFCPLKATATRGIKIKVDFAKTILIDSITKQTFCNNRINTTNVYYRSSRILLINANVFTVQLSDSAGSFNSATTIGTKASTDSIGFIPISIPANLFVNGNYKIRIIASSDTTIKGVPFDIKLVAGFGTPVITNNKDSFCQGLGSIFKVTPNSSGLTYKWLKNNTVIANQTKDSLLADSAFTYRVVVSNEGCTDTSNAKYLTVYSKPIAGFLAQNTFCISNSNQTINLTNTSTINSGSMSYNWWLGNNTNSTVTNPNLTVTDSSNLTIKLVVTSNKNCVDSLTKNVSFRLAPKALFTTNDSTQCINGNSFVFTNLSDSIGKPTQYTWNFGTGNNLDTNYNAQPFSYTNAGNYVVKLKAISANGCIDSIAKQISVFDKPSMVNFSINNAVQCLKNNNFVFTNQSLPNNNTLSYLWKFGDGDISTNVSPTKKYLNEGSYTVILVVNLNSACIDSITKNVFINANPIAAFSVNDSSQCFKGNSFSFTNTTANAVSQNWDFGNGSTSTLANPTKSYTLMGNYQVKLIVKSGNNCFDTIAKTIKVVPSANLYFNINNAVQCMSGNKFIFTNTSNIYFGTAQYQWVLGEADTFIGTQVIKQFKNSGNFEIKLLSLTDQNCAENLSKTIIVNASPNIGTITGNAAPTSITTPFAYSVLSQANSTYNWSATNGTIQSGQGTNAVKVIWPSTGSGSLKTKIIDYYGCIDSTNLSINITTVGINNLSLENDLNVFPNPTKTSITITNKTNLIGKKYVITNLIGQIVLIGKLNLDETIVNLETLQSGMYFLSIDSLNKQSIKIIKE